MKLGVRAHDYGKMSAEAMAELLKREGFDAAQLAAAKAIEGVDSYIGMSREKAGEIRKAFDENGIFISVLGCYIDISCRDRAVYENHLELFKSAIQVSSWLNAGMVGTESSYGVVEMEDKEKTIGQVTEGLSILAEEGERMGVNVGIEPVATHTLYSPEWTRRLLDQVGSSRLQVIFDPVNMLAPDMVNRQDEVWETCFQAFGREIAAIHLKDFKLDENGMFVPCPLGTGLMEYDTLFRWLHREKPEISILREEIDPVTAQDDVAFMKKWIEK
ncbi:MAG: sugar phosphate isomerase/epimerase family protein [Lachnospiraceae bacterium]|nr:sugar phosphate isomerase/epimerase family protein [Lachnospiraceae bacterium]